MAFVTGLQTTWSRARAPAGACCACDERGARAAVLKMQSGGREAPNELETSRRQILRLLGALPVVAASAAGVRAAEVPAGVFRNDQFLYEFAPPKGDWKANQTTISGGRNIFAWVLDTPSAVGNITAVATPIPGDFQKLTSFGTIDAVADTILPPNRGLDGKMISSSTVPISVEGSQGSAYLFDYEIQPPGTTMNRRHLWTLFSLKPGQWIVSVTAQSDAGSSSEKLVKDAFDELVKTFKIL